MSTSTDPQDPPVAEKLPRPLHVRTHHVSVDAALDAYVRQRASAKLGKYVRHLARVTVRFDDTNGPKRGQDTLCRIKVMIAGLTGVVVEDIGTGAREAFDLAIERADNIVLRTLERRSRSTSRHRAARLKRGPPPPEAFMPG